MYIDTMLLTKFCIRFKTENVKFSVCRKFVQSHMLQNLVAHNDEVSIEP